MKENKKEILPATSARSKTERTRKQLEAMESVASLQDRHIVDCGSMTDQLALRLRQEKEMSLEQRSHRHAEYIERDVIKQITSKGLPYASRFYFDSHKRFWLKEIVNLGWGQLTHLPLNRGFQTLA